MTIEASPTEAASRVNRSIGASIMVAAPTNNGVTRGLPFAHLHLRHHRVGQCEIMKKRQHHNDLRDILYIIIYYKLAMSGTQNLLVEHVRSYADQDAEQCQM
jgi:hypothetical protein